MDGEAISKAEPAATIAVIFGASEFPHADALSASPAFAGSASAFAAYLQSERGFQLAEAQVLNLFDDTSNVIEQNDQLVTHLQRNQDASDLIIYYVGHGGFLPDREYFLALRSTKRGAEGITGLRIRALAHSLEEHFPGKRVFLILDCCFAGEAVAQFQSDDIGTIVESKTFDALPSSGTSLLVAASRDEPAIAPTGAAYTMFSDCFLAALTQGLAGGGQKLSLADIGELVQKRVRSKFGQRGVRPEIHSPRQTGGDVAKAPLFPNPAYQPEKPRRLPVGIQQALQNPIADVRQGAIRPLAQYLSAGDAALARLARAELEHLAAHDDSRSVQRRAREALGSGQTKPRETPAAKTINDASSRGDVAPQAKPAPPTKPMTKRAPWGIAAGIAGLVLVAAVVVWGFIYKEAGEQQVASPPEAQVQPPPAEAGSDVQEAAATVSPPQASKAESEGIEGLLASAESALDENDLDQAARYLASAESMQPGNAAAAKLHQRIATARTAMEERETIERLLSQAQDDLVNDRLTSPADNNAVQRYRAVLDLDAGNRAALAGLERVVRRYLALADGAMAGEMFDKAEAYLARAESVGPANPDLPKMRARLEEERRVAEQRGELETLLANAERSLGESDFDQAEVYLIRAEAIDAGNSRLAALRAELKKALATPVQLSFAVFPFESLANCHYSVRDEVTDAADAIVAGQTRASIEYSYYAEGADAGRIPSVGALWSNNAARREPLMDMVRKAGRDLGVNGVLMVWYECSQSQYVPVDTYKVEVYLIDVDGDRIFHAKEAFLDTRRAIAQVFNQFFTAYGFDSG